MLEEQANKDTEEELKQNQGDDPPHVKSKFDALSHQINYLRKENEN